uniref:Uncharacterized protein n=1 Tax=Triticum urartu TaxID=4572 RepID=A0A8R7TXM1_TRIUA
PPTPSSPSPPASLDPHVAVSRPSSISSRLATSTSLDQWRGTSTVVIHIQVEEARPRPGGKAGCPRRQTGSSTLWWFSLQTWEKHVVGEEVCNGSTLKTLGTFARAMTLGGALATAKLVRSFMLDLADC